MFKVKEGIELFGDAYLRHPTGNYGSVEIDGGATSSWEGYSIGGRAVFMHDNGTASGIYDDVNNKWLFLAYHGGDSRIYHNGASQLEAKSGYGFAPNQMRSPIFYDSNDTAYYVNPNSVSRIYDLDVVGKRVDIASSANWDEVGFSKQTNLHFQGHNQFWIGAGNGTWFKGTANTKDVTGGIAADATNAHDLLITTMQASSTQDRGITFAVDNSGTGTSGWRLGKWHSGDAYDASMLVVDGQLRAKGSYTDEADWYANDYSVYYSAGQSHWSGDTNAGWHKPSIVASTALQIQSGNTGTNSRKPQIQFHQYGYGGPAIEYDGPNKTMTFGELGSSNPDRVNTFNWRFDNTTKAQINASQLYHNSSVRSPIFYDSNNTGYYLDPASTSNLNALNVQGQANFYRHIDATSTWGGAKTLFLGWYSGKTTIGNNAHSAHDAVSAAPVNTIHLNNPTTAHSDLRVKGELSDARGNVVTGYSHSGSDFTSGTLVRTSIPATATNGASFVLECTGKSYSAEPPFSFMAQGYLYSNTIINASGVNNGDLRLTYIKAMQLDGYLCFWWPRISYWNSFEVRVRDAGGSSHNLVTNIENAADPSTATKKVQINLKKSVKYDTNSNSGDLYAQIMYDANDTSYYVNPNSVSDMHTLKLTSHRDHTPRWDFSCYVAESQHYYGQSSTQTMYLGESNHIHIRSIGQASGDFRAPVFYDSNNTGYYTNPASTSRLNVVNANSYLVNGAPLEAGAKNGIFWENDTTITSNYTLTAGKNAGTFGPVTIANNVTVTVPNGSTWTIV